MLYPKYIHGEEILPIFVALHKWKPQEDLTIYKELLAGFSAMGEGKINPNIKLDATYTGTAHDAYCVWESPSKEALEKEFVKYLPTLLKNTEFMPVVQTYPPTMEYVLGLMQQLIKAASK